METLAKLDSYDYVVLPGAVRINLNGTNDPDLVDIMSEIEQANGNIYIDGCYYAYLDNYQLFPTKGGAACLVLEVVQIESN